MNSKTKKLDRIVHHRADWASGDRLWKGMLEGHEIGSEVTLLFFSTTEIGEGPRLHVHPYDEVFIVRSGKALFTIGNQKTQVEAGDILLGPAGIPHKFQNLGPDPLETIDIHVSERWIQKNLLDPECWKD